MDHGPLHRRNRWCFGKPVDDAQAKGQGAARERGDLGGREERGGAKRHGGESIARLSPPLGPRGSRGPRAAAPRSGTESRKGRCEHRLLATTHRPWILPAGGLTWAPHTSSARTDRADPSRARRAVGGAACRRPGRGGDTRLHRASWTFLAHVRNTGNARSGSPEVVADGPGSAPCARFARSRSMPLARSTPQQSGSRSPTRRSSPSTDPNAAADALRRRKPCDASRVRRCSAGWPPCGQAARTARGHLTGGPASASSV